MIKESKIHKQILKLDPQVIAQEFTRIDSLVFCDIDATEYLDDLWSRHGPHLHVNISKFEEMTNYHLYWTVTTILQEQSSTRRAEIIRHMIKIAKYLKDLRNYNAMFAILSGLSHSLVQRLKPTWEKVAGKYRKMKKDLELFMDPTRNFVKYRNLLNVSDRPLIPYFPVGKKDLTFIYLGNDSMVENVVNFEKLRMIAREVKSCKLYCMKPMMPPPVEAVMVHLGTPPKSLHGSLRIKFKSPTAYQATVNNLKRVYTQHQMRKRVKAYVEEPYIITDEGHLDVLFKILMTVCTHKKSDKKPESPSANHSHRTSRQSSIPSSIPMSPKQGSVSSDSPPPSPKKEDQYSRSQLQVSFTINGGNKPSSKRAASPKIWAPL
ncbi:rap guanine nucleotide exchange factor 2-like isoform X1 [Dysidea avara]|uniref:rap guanine nucleotide exchange factor 2-like isoform X1 n=1 Tax=Dysidea avara TaxID=196820 RepID=UPI00332B64B1